MSISVCGIGVVSAIGVGCQENFDSLLSMSCGIGRNNLFDTSVDVPVGEVKLSNSELKEMLGIEANKVVSRTALLGAVAAKEALCGVEVAQGMRIGLISSTSVGGMDLSENFYREFMIDSAKGRLRDIVGHDCFSSTEFIAQQCGITGFRTTISTACSSAANAVIMGARMLESDMLDYVLVGGTDALCRFTLCGFNSLMILDGELCRPFDQSRSGLNLGEGAGYILLSKQEGGLCQLTGYANANDAFHQTASSDEGEGAFMAMNSAMAMAGYPTIDYINLHGTGTYNNDLSETQAIKRLFANCDVPLSSSTKSFTGHTLAASGGVESVYCVLSLLNGVRYASLRVGQPIEQGVPTVDATQRNVELRNVLSNSFGFGGNCSSLIFSKL